MAHFIPEKCDVERRPWSEQAVFEQIKQYLSKDWIVFHSYTYLKPDENDFIWDGEIDFLLYHPSQGFLVIEVKGGSISYQNGCWFQDGQVINPVVQAKNNKFAILKLLQERLKRPIPLRFAHAVCFPSCQIPEEMLPPEARGIVLRMEDMPRLDRIASRLIQQAPLPKGNGGVLDSREVLDVLSPEFEAQQDLRSRMKEEEQRIEKLSEQPSVLLESLVNFRHLQFVGGAGTGKTQLAIRKARMVNDEGGLVLLLCYNELLARKIRLAVGKRLHYIQVAAFFRFCLDVLGISKEEYERNKNNPLVYSKALPQLLNKYLDRLPIVYDAVIVDEAQDFTQEMWQVVSRLVKPDGYFYVFYDPDQNIFHKELHIPEMEYPPVVMNTNYRNTASIFKALEPYRSIPVKLLSESPVGAQVIRRTGDCRQMLAEELKRLIETEHIVHTDIVVLGGHALKHTCLGNNPQAGEYCLADTTLTLRKNEISYFTYMKFKGCSSKVVILLDVDEEDPRWNSRGIYTAASRASHLLIVLKSR